ASSSLKPSVVIGTRSIDIAKVSHPAWPRASTLNREIPVLSGTWSRNNALRGLKGSGGAAYVGLQRSHLEDIRLQRFDRARHRDRAGQSCIIWNVVKQGRAPDVLAVGHRLGTFGCIEDQGHLAVFYGVHDVRPALQDLVHNLALHPVGLEVTARAAGRDDL